MKTYAAILAVALAAILMTSDAAQARRWVYLPGPYAHPRLLVRPVEPMLAPMASPLVIPEVVIGHLGHWHYVAPI
jgi:hypothetical protein